MGRIRRVEEFYTPAQHDADKDEAGACGVDTEHRQQQPGAASAVTVSGSPFAENFGRNTALVDEVIHSKLKLLPQKQLEGRLAYYRREALGHPTSKGRTEFKKEAARTETELRRRAMNAKKEVPAPRKTPKPTTKPRSDMAEPLDMPMHIVNGGAASSSPARAIGAT